MCQEYIFIDTANCKQSLALFVKKVKHHCMTGMTGRKTRALQEPPVVSYKALENFPTALYGTTRGTCSARVFRPIMIVLKEKNLKRTMLFVFLVPLGSVPELPAESCAEIRASEGEDAVSGNYWFDSIKPGEVVLARCDMSKLGKLTFGV